jgi:phage-related protein
MPETRVVFYRETDGSVPTLEWLSGLPAKVRDKCIEKIERLQELGHELRPPESDYLGNEIYELRTRFGPVRYRMLYFFHGTVAAVISHGFLKKTQKTPPKQIQEVQKRKRKFEQNPQRHTQEIHL